MKRILITTCCTVALLFTAAVPQTANAEPLERHPEIHEAIHSLENAIRHLREAKHDFGGHREAAIEASQHAVEQLRAALEFDKR